MASTQDGAAAEYNALPLAVFREQYLANLESTFPECLVGFETGQSIDETTLQQCFELLRETSASAYAASTRKWHPDTKLAEMREVDMRYLLLLERPDQPFTENRSSLLGFASFQLTVEDDMDVVYCYEIHLQSAARGQGLGARLMQIMEDLGRATGMEKAMLTVFTSNEAARKFYALRGYEYYDEEPVPARKKLRSGLKGKNVQPGWYILAKTLT